MNPSIEKLKQNLDTQPVNAVYDDAESLMDLLCYIYMTESPLDTATIRFQHQQLNCLLERLTWEENDQVFHTTLDICDSYIRKAFLDGLKIGHLLLHELSSV